MNTFIYVLAGFGGLVGGAAILWGIGEFVWYFMVDTNSKRCIQCKKRSPK